MAQRISSGSSFEEEIGYSRAVVDGGFVFVSGTTGYDYDTMTICGDVVAQAAQCCANIAATLAQAGSSMDDVLRVMYVFPHTEDFRNVGRHCVEPLQPRARRRHTYAPICWTPKCSSKSK